MYRKIELVLLLVLIAGIFTVTKNLEKYAAAENLEVISMKSEEPIKEEKKKYKRIVIDAGHGENDPGKVGIGGTLEKDINLEIALLIQKDLEERGYEVVMTRQDDHILAAEGENRKLADLKKRVAVMNGAHACLAVSIHQNSYPEEHVHGAQVFYYPESAAGEDAAGKIQEELQQMDPQNKRQKKANADYYMLRKTEIPVVIAECGFLSNREEEARLKTREYQTKIAVAIVKGIVKFAEEKRSMQSKILPVKNWKVRKGVV